MAGSPLLHAHCSGEPRRTPGEPHLGSLLGRCSLASERAPVIVSPASCQALQVLETTVQMLGRHVSGLGAHGAFVCSPSWSVTDLHGGPVLCWGPATQRQAPRVARGGGAAEKSGLKLSTAPGRGRREGLGALPLPSRLLPWNRLSGFAPGVGWGIHPAPLAPPSSAGWCTFCSGGPVVGRQAGMSGLPRGPSTYCPKSHLFAL